MMRILHRWLCLTLAALLFVAALSGGALPLFPVLDSLQTPQADPNLTVAELVARVQAFHHVAHPWALPCGVPGAISARFSVTIASGLVADRQYHLILIETRGRQHRAGRDAAINGDILRHPVTGTAIKWIIVLNKRLTPGVGV